jgi:hypothetical protein
VNLFAFRAKTVWNAGVHSVRQGLSSVTIPQRLLIASALTYGAVFALLLAYGRPGLGIGQGFCIAVILAAAATSPVVGAVAGAGALFLYELGIHDHGDHPGLAFGDFDHAPALSHLATYVVVGVLTGFLARRVRLMLAQSLFVLEELVDIANERVELAAADTEAAESVRPG